MTERPSDSLQQKLSDRLRYYEDIGVGPFYRDRIGPVSPQQTEEVVASPELAQSNQEQSLPNRESKPLPPPAPHAPSRKFELPPVVDSGLSLFEAANKIENDTLLKIREDLGDCTRCRLHKTRHTIVFGDGNPKAQLVFVGEGPGADEDAQGLPFVGRAGKLLTQMIEAMGLQ